MAQIFIEPLARVFTNTGAIGAGYKYYFYTTGTTTPINSYTTQALSVANAWPLVADSNGRFPIAWLSNLATSKVVLTDADGVVIETVDPIGITASTTSLNDLDVRPTSYWGLTTGTTSAYVLTANPSISAYSNVQTFIFQAHVANIINPTMAVSGLSALNLKKYTGQGTKVALQAGDLQATQRYVAINDGVDIVILNPRSLVINSGPAAALTIATGVVTLTNDSSSYSLDTEGSASSDDLDTISGGQDGQVIFLSNANNGRNVIIRNNIGNIFNPVGVDITLDVTTDIVELRYSAPLTKWIVVSTNNVGYFANSKTTNGYTYLPNGWIIQVGFVNNTTAGSTSTFPIAFPTACLGVYGLALSNNNTTNRYVVSSTASGFTWGTIGVGTGNQFYYIALGY